MDFAIALASTPGGNSGALWPPDVTVLMCIESTVVDCASAVLATSVEWRMGESNVVAIEMTTVD